MDMSFGIKKAVWKIDLLFETVGSRVPKPSVLFVKPVESFYKSDRL